MRNGMAKDFSWAASAKEYVKVYERARQARAAAP
jgi:glycogen synthase